MEAILKNQEQFIVLFTDKNYSIFLPQCMEINAIVLRGRDMINQRNCVYQLAGFIKRLQIMWIIFSFRRNAIIPRLIEA